MELIQEICGIRILAKEDFEHLKEGSLISLTSSGRPVIINKSPRRSTIEISLPLSILNQSTDEDSFLVGLLTHFRTSKEELPVNLSSLYIEETVAEYIQLLSAL